MEGPVLLCPSGLVSIRASRVGRDAPEDLESRRLDGFNPRVPCGTRSAFDADIDRLWGVSIRASRVGRDIKSKGNHEPSERVSIRASRVGRDEKLLDAFRRADVSIRASRVGRDVREVKIAAPTAEVSIRASRVGRDEPGFATGDGKMMFQSARPVWDAIPKV